MKQSNLNNKSKNLLFDVIVDAIKINTVESRHLEPPKGNENWFKKSGARNIGSKITVKQVNGKQLLVQLVIRVFEKSRVREIGIPLYHYMYI